MSSADHLVLGDWNARCDGCGRKMKGSQLKQTWQGNWTCQRCWEPRQPQDFVRSIAEHPTPPFVRNPEDLFLPTGDMLIQEAALPANAPPYTYNSVLLEANVNTYVLTEG